VAAMDDQRPPSDDEPADRTRGSGGGPLHLVVAWLLIAGVVSVLALAAEDQRREQRSGRSLRVAPTLQDDQLLGSITGRDPWGPSGSSGDLGWGCGGH